jgi:segregation and condensation protein B
LKNLNQHIEALIFMANPSVALDDLVSVLRESLDIPVKPEEVLQAIRDLTEKFNQEAYAMEIVEMAGGYRFMTKGIYHHTVSIYLKQSAHKKLSKSALESLSIIAYKQPVSKSEIESIRGVNSDYSLQKLLDKGLIEITGRSDGPGKPLLYGTTVKFMDYFGLKSVQDLPKLKDIEDASQQIGDVGLFDQTSETEPVS